MSEKKWPKKLLDLTEEQKSIKDEFMKKWHEELPNFSVMEKFNHKWGINKLNIPVNCRTLEVGAGLGAHIGFEDLTKQKYYALELRSEMAKEISRKYPAVQTTVGDIQEKLDFNDQYFDRIISIHVLEHLPNLPAALLEIKRLLKNNGFCDFVIPCEGSPAYLLARQFSGKRCFKKHFNMSYDWVVKTEHINMCDEIIEEIINAGFQIQWNRYFPIPLPLTFCNLAIGLRCEKRKE